MSYPLREMKDRLPQAEAERLVRQGLALAEIRFDLEPFAAYIGSAMDCDRLTRYFVTAPNRPSKVDILYLVAKYDRPIARSMALALVVAMLKGARLPEGLSGGWSAVLSDALNLCVGAIQNYAVKGRRALVSAGVDRDLVESLKAPGGKRRKESDAAMEVKQ